MEQAGESHLYLNNWIGEGFCVTSGAGLGGGGLEEWAHPNSERGWRTGTHMPRLGSLGGEFGPLFWRFFMLSIFTIS